MAVEVEAEELQPQPQAEREGSWVEKTWNNVHSWVQARLP